MPPSVTILPRKRYGKKCESEGGQKVDFADHILELWGRIGYSPPSNDDLGECLANSDEVEEFTPVKKISIKNSKFAGINVKCCRCDIDMGEVAEFLCENGLPEDLKEAFTIKGNGILSITGLSDDVCQIMVKNIDGKDFKGRKLFSSGIVALTPEKPTVNSNNRIYTCDSNSTSSTVLSSCDQQPTVNADVADTAQEKSPFIAAREVFEEGGKWNHLLLPTNSEVVRRHSISVIDRTPPRGSIAEEILSRHQGFQKAKSALNDLKDLTDQLSEFGSCVSSNQSSSESEEETVQQHKNTNEKRRLKKNKRKLKVTPDKEEFLKKPKSN